MAAISVATTEQAGRIYQHFWEAMGNADTGDPIEFAGGVERTVHMFGTWGGATLVIEGSIDGTTYETLTDPQGNALSKTADAIESILEMTRFIRPVTSGGTGTNVDVYMITRRPSN